MPVIKLILLLLFLGIFVSLGSALFALARRDSSLKMAKALTWRISLSLLVFVFLLFAFWMGWIHPHHL